MVHSMAGPIGTSLGSSYLLGGCRSGSVRSARVQGPGATVEGEQRRGLSVLVCGGPANKHMAIAPNAACSHFYVFIFK